MEMDSLALYSRGNPLLCRQHIADSFLLRAWHFHSGNYSLDRSSVAALDNSSFLESLHRHIFHKEEVDSDNATVNDLMHVGSGTVPAYFFLLCIDTLCLRLHGIFLCHS